MGNKCFVPLTGGEIVSVIVPNPAIGIDWVYVFPADYEYTIMAVFYRLFTGITAGNRYEMFTIYPADSIDYCRVMFSAAIPASQQRRFSFDLGSRRADNLVITTFHDALPDCRWAAGFRCGSATANIKATDQLQDIALTLKRWRTQ